MRNFIILFLFLLAPAIYAQDISFVSKASKNNLGINERLRIDFTMNQNGDNFSPPDFSDFRVIGGPNQSVSNSWVNGKKNFSKTYTYFLSPQKKGLLKIGQATVEIDGEVYKTIPIEINVSDAVDKPRDPNSPEYLIDENLHLVTEISNNQPYLNQGITVLYKLYFKSPLQISDARESDSPKFKDFWNHQIKIPQLKVERGNYKGVDYNLVVWRKTVLYPQKTGELILDPLTLNLMIDIPSKRTDFFGNRVYEQSSRSISSGKKSISVKELPKTGKPSNFSGAVGKFDFNVSLDKDALKASESFQIRVKASGLGNLKLFNLPKIVVPKTLEVYEPERKEKIKMILKGMQGTVEDNYTIVPKYKGKYPISPVSFSYFDPESNKYFTLNSQPLVVDVYEGPISSNNPGMNISKAGSERNILNTDETFRFIKLEPKFELISKETFWGSKVFYFLLTVPFLVLLLLYIIWKNKIKKSSDIENIKQREANKLSRKFLGEAKRKLGDKSNFYNSLELALYNYLKARLKIKTSDYSKEKIKEVLKRKKISDQEINVFIQVIKNCEIARFSPTTNVKMKKDFDQALMIMASIDKKI
ncbi:MAG: BatD family protein [Bacteroidota bacterium]|nr:BatD family protein [Bacteroidota bacterium]